MSSTGFLLKRYLFPKEGNLLNFALWVSVLGVALGIAVLILVLSVMNGFLHLFQDKYTNITSEIVVLPRHGRPVDPHYREKLLKIKGVAAATPFAFGQGMIYKTSVGGSVIEGIDFETSKEVTPWKEIWTEEPLWELQKKTPHWIWLGKGLSEKLKVKAGDTVNVMVGEGAKGVIPFLVTGITKFGIYDHDQRYAYVDFKVLNQYFHQGAYEPMYKIRVKPGADIDETALLIKKTLGQNAGVKRWKDLNQNIFLAVQNQKQMLFAVMQVIVALAGVNVINLLMMSSHYRKRDIAILRSMGMQFKSVVAFFLIQGAAVAGAGAVLGVGLGYALCGLVRWFQPALLSESIYNVSKLPIQIEFVDVLLICVVAFVLCLVFSLLPALRAALSRPVNALRYE